MGVFDPENKRLIMDKIADPTQVSDFSFETTFADIKISGHTSNLIDKNLYYLGTYEPNILRTMGEILESSQGKVFVDVGANFGLHSLYARKFATQIHALEPFAPLRERFQSLIIQNQIKNIKLYPDALGNKREERDFFHPPQTNLGTGSFVQDPQFHHQSSERLTTVASGVFLQEHGIMPDLIKIDTEGYEVEIIEGMLELLSNKPIALIFEYSKHTHEKLLQNSRVRDFLLSHYELTTYLNETDVKSARISWCLNRFSNVIALPKN